MTYELLEERLLAEYLAQFYTGRKVRTHVRISGPRGRELYARTPDPVRGLLVNGWPEADAILQLEDEYTVLEAIVHRPQETIGQLLYYMWLLPGSVGFEDVRPDQVRGYVVTGLDDPQLHAFLSFLGIGYEVYSPRWLQGKIAARRGGTAPG